MADSRAGHVLARVGARAAAGVWRHRAGVLLSAVVAVGLGVYATMNWTGSTPSLASSGIMNGDGDCADTAMAVIADKSPAAAHRAYQCMDASYQQRVSEAQFVGQMQSQRVPDVTKLERVGDYRTASGATLVYYAVEGGSQSAGYIVYLGRDGKVLRIE